MGIHAILLAGQRPERDRLSEGFGVALKALVPVLGEAMVSRVARTLLAHPDIGKITILSQDGAAIAAEPGTSWMGNHPAISFQLAGMSVSEAIANAIRQSAADYPFLVTTADHVLLDRPMIDAMLEGAGDADVAAGVVERSTLLSAYPGSRRTWLEFRAGAYSGANIFLFRSPRAMKVLDLWGRIEGQRKRGRAVIRAFGPLMLLATGLRIVSLKQALAWASWRLGVRAIAVELPMAEACIDVDKPADHELVTAILSSRA